MKLDFSAPREKPAGIFPLGFVISVCLVALTGCASSVALKEQDRASLRNVAVSDEVILPEAMFYQGPKETLWSVLGVVGALAAEEGRKKSEDVIKDTMSKSDIDVRRIAKDTFTGQLKASGLFNEVVSSAREGYPRFQLSIRIYGFAQPNGFSSQLKPMLGIEGVLLNTDNTVLWQKYAYVTNLNDQTPSHTLEEYLEEPERMSGAFTAAAKIVTGELINHLGGN